MKKKEDLDLHLLLQDAVEAKNNRGIFDGNSSSQVVLGT